MVSINLSLERLLWWLTAMLMLLLLTFLQIQVSLSAIRRVLDVTSDFALVYVHHPLLLNFFLFYPELMGRFGHRILQLWFSCEDYSQIESQDAVIRINTGFSDSSNYFNSFLCMLKDNPSALLLLLVRDHFLWMQDHPVFFVQKIPQIQSSNTVNCSPE